MPIQKKDIPKFKAALLAKRAALVGDSNHLEEEAVRKGKDEAATLDISNFADLGSDNYEQEFDLSMLEHQGETLRAVDEALQRIEDGTFGTCDMCGKALRKGRLLAMPHARFCVSCQNEQEQGGGY
jgi:DnaK suppressor protein